MKGDAMSKLQMDSEIAWDTGLDGGVKQFERYYSISRSRPWEYTIFLLFRCGRISDVKKR